MNKHLKSKIQNALGVQFHRPKRGSDLFHDLDKHYGVENFRLVYDVGANIGQSAVLYHQWFPRARIHSFEPVSRSFKELEAKTRGLDRVTCVPQGMGAEAAACEIHVHPDSSQNSIHYQAKDAPTETIELGTLDQYAEEQGAEHIDFLKIDTEGFEMEVLQGAATLLEAGRIGFIFVETAFATQQGQFVTLPKLEAHLRGHGYEFFALYDQHAYFDGRKSLFFCNATFVSPKFAAP